MKLCHDRDLDAPLERVWERAKDVRVVAAAFPGGRITTVEGDAFTGTVTVGVGPIKMTYDGTGRMERVDEHTHTAAIAARGTQRLGPGVADIHMTLHLSALGPERTHASLVTDLAVNGASVPVAGPLAGRVSGPLVAAFLDRLAAEDAPVAAHMDLVGTLFRRLSRSR